MNKLILLGAMLGVALTFSAPAAMAQMDRPHVDDHRPVVHHAVHRRYRWVHHHRVYY